MSPAFATTTAATTTSAAELGRAPSRSDQAWAQARALLGSAVVGAAALAATPAQALTEVPTEPTLTYGGSVSGNHNASGWFTSDAHSGSADGRVFGALDEGVKLYGESTLAREAYMFNTLTTHPVYGWQYYSSTSTGLAMAWWGQATGLRTDQYDPDTGDLTQAGDLLAFHYDFSVTGPQNSNWELRGGFTGELDLDNNAGLLQGNLFNSAYVDGSLDSDGAHSFAGELRSNRLDWLPDSGPVYWVITLTADLPYDPSQDLRLFVPQQSIDAGVNFVPVLIPIPEPATWALWLAGLVGLGGLVRQRHATARGSNSGGAASHRQ